MKCKYILIYTLLLILCAAAAFRVASDENTDLPFHVIIHAQGGDEQIRCWSEDGESFYIFLPSHADSGNVRFSLKTGSPVSLGGVDILEDMSCAIFVPGETYTLRYDTITGTKQKNVTFMKSDGIAAMFVDTESGSMERIHRSNENSETGDFRLYSPEGTRDSGGTVEKIEGRGNGTWNNHEKKPYNLSLQESTDLLGMGAAREWILLADAGDYSRMRNKLVFDFASKIGLAFSPDSQWVDLYLNGQYAGLYLLCERNEIHPERVDIVGNGSFLVSLELESRLIAKNYPYVLLESGQALRIHRSSAADSVQIRQQWQSIENAILSEEGIDAVTGQRLDTLIDLDSWVRKYLIEEVFGNLDGCCISQFFYWDAGDPTGRVYAGPVWDYDASMGNEVLWQLQSPERWFGNRLVVREGLTIPWFYALCRNDAFSEQVISLYRSEILPELELLLENGLVRYASRIKASWQMDQVRWQLDSGDIYRQTEQIRRYMRERIAFLDSAWIQGTQYLTVTADASLGTAYAYYSVLPGAALDNLPVFEDDPYQHFCGWYVVGTDEPFDPAAPIYEDTALYARWEATDTQKANVVYKIVPVSFFALLLIGVVVWDARRWNRSR